MNRSATPFVVVANHCPFYSTNEEHYEEWHTRKMKESLEPLFLGCVDNDLRRGQSLALKTTRDLLYYKNCCACELLLG